MDFEKILREYDNSREKRQAGIFYSLFVLTDRIGYTFDKVVQDITFRQFTLLIMLNISDKSSYTELGELLGCSRQNVKNLAAGLEKKGFVEIRQDEKDKRQVIISPTEKSVEHFKAMEALYNQALNKLFDVYNDEEIKELYSLTTKLYDGVNNLEKAWEK